VEDTVADDLIALTSAWLDVMPEGRFDDFPGRVADDFVLRLPFVPPGVPSEFKGREAAQAVLRGSAANRSPLVFTDKVMLRTEDPEVVVTTARAEAVMASGRPYRNSYVIFTRIRGGVVLEHTEYLNPLAIIEAGQPPE
jgi:ketosteroid isomerase-like protein